MRVKVPIEFKLEYYERAETMDNSRIKNFNTIQIKLEIFV